MRPDTYQIPRAVIDKVLNALLQNYFICSEDDEHNNDEVIEAHTELKAIVDRQDQKEKDYQEQLTSEKLTPVTIKRMASYGFSGMEADLEGYSCNEDVIAVQDELRLCVRQQIAKEQACKKDPAIKYADMAAEVSALFNENIRLCKISVVEPV